MAEDFNPTEWITTAEAAELTGYASAYFRQLVKRRRLQAQKRGRDWFLTKLESGQTFVEKGVLSKPDDVCFLYLAELEALAADQQRDWASLVQEWRQAYTRERLRRQIPQLLLSDGQAFYGSGTGTQQNGEDVITGSPVSPGAVEGMVRVVFDPRGAQIAPGEILVCPGTDPSWTPLLLAASGLVMEVGGMMTHGSVVAREYGIPAVVGVHQATRRLHTGQRIRVDGNAGTVAILENNEAAST